MTTPMLRLSVSCPKCGAAPTVQITPAERDLHATVDPDADAISVKCPARYCGHIYAVRARAYQNATETREAA